MVDEVVTRQELIDAKRDAQDLGKAVNEKVIVSPRYGEDFKSLPMIAAEFQDAINTIVIDDGVDKKEFYLLFDNILEVEYFYGRIPVKWLENDDQEGLQPRVIDYKRLISLRNHLKFHPQLAPSIARLIDRKFKLFDGQHKLAAQVLNNNTEVDIKVYVSPDDTEKAILEGMFALINPVITLTEGLCVAIIR